ncbi:MAG: hypothetical protein GY757_46590, partial [bacterium]|nr:hypothetical protein [bacterium]
HLVVDGVSWRILMEDIDTLFKQYKKGETLQLPKKTESFKTWSEELNRYANSDKFLKEKEYWRQTMVMEKSLIKKDFDEPTGYLEDSMRHSFQLSEEETRQLMTKVNNAYTTNINEILLTALGRALKRSFQIDGMYIHLEGHGREEILREAGITINRTVGWFTTVYPVQLEGFDKEEPERQIIETKERLRKVPNQGIGYGILKYLTHRENKQGMTFETVPQISFNFMGELELDGAQGETFKMAPETAGEMKSPKQERDHELDVFGMITDKRLKMMIGHSRKQYKEETVSKLLEYFKEELQRIISICMARSEKEITPSDMGYKDLSIDDLDDIFD